MFFLSGLFLSAETRPCVPLAWSFGLFKYSPPLVQWSGLFMFEHSPPLAWSFSLFKYSPPYVQLSGLFVFKHSPPACPLSDLSVCSNIHPLLFNCLVFLSSNTHHLCASCLVFWSVQILTPFSQCSACLILLPVHPCLLLPYKSRASLGVIGSGGSGLSCDWVAFETGG